MVNAAVGGSSVVGRGLESSLGIRGGSLYPLRFISADFERDSKENASTAITGHAGRDKGTPGAVEFQGKLKYDATVYRLALDLACMFGRPTVKAIQHLASVTVAGSGTSYGTTVTFGGGGTGATLPTAHAVVSGGNVTSIVVDTPGSDITAPLTVSVATGTGQTFTAVMATDAWQAQFRPGKLNPTLGSLWVYIDEGGSYSAEVQLGRRASELSIKEDANKRLEVDATYAPATGDSISGFPVAKSSNTGTFSNGSSLLGKVTTRGRRPTIQADGVTPDPNWTGGKSLYLKCTASDANTITFKAAFDTASGATDGTGFPSTSFSGSTTFVVRRPGAALSTDGFVSVVLMDATLVGQFGENNEPYEITFGDQDLSVVLANDIFEIPYQLPAGGQSLAPLAENRVSAFHILRNVAGASIQFDSGTVKLSRPFTPYYVNGRKLASSIDATGDIGGTWQFKKRIFDRVFRQYQEQAQRFTVEDIMKFNVPIVAGTQVYEGVHIFAPQAAVSTMKSGEIATKDTLEEDITIEVEQPDVAPTPPTPVLAPSCTFDADASFPYQINVISRIDLTPIS
jgi:hypothetical protein